MELLRWIFECCEQGIQVTTRAVRKVADEIVPGFRDTSIRARTLVVWRFLCRVGLSHRLATHIAQKSHVETEAVSFQFMEYKRRKVGKMSIK